VVCFEDIVFYISNYKESGECTGKLGFRNHWTVWPCFSGLRRQVYYNCDTRPNAVKYGVILEYDCWTKRCRNSNADWSVQGVVWVEFFKISFAICFVKRLTKELSTQQNYFRYPSLNPLFVIVVKRK